MRDLGKLIKSADDAHRSFEGNLRCETVHEPRAIHEVQLYKLLKTAHSRAVPEGAVVFSRPWLLVTRLLAHLYLRLYPIVVADKV